MVKLIACVIASALAVGCHHDPTPADDLAAFCSLPVGDKPNLAKVGPLVDAAIKTPVWQDMIKKLKGGEVSLAEFQKFIETQMTAANLTQCPAYTALFLPPAAKPN
jgi:hypothetical protein